MKKSVLLLLGCLGVLGLLLGPGICQALTIDLYETNNGFPPPTGTPSLAGPDIYLHTTVFGFDIPVPVEAGYVKIMEGTKVEAVIAFVPDNALEKSFGLADHVQLFSGLISPTFLAGLPVVTIPETMTFTNYTPKAGDPGYSILSPFGISENYRAAVPEPASMLFLGAGLLGLVGFRRKVKKLQKSN